MARSREQKELWKHLGLGFNNDIATVAWGRITSARIQLW